MKIFLKMFNLIIIIQCLMIMVKSVRPNNNRGNRIPPGLREVTNPSLSTSSTSNTPSNQRQTRQSISRGSGQHHHNLSPTSRITRQTRQMNLNGRNGNNLNRQVPNLNAEQQSSQAVIQHELIRSGPTTRQQTRQTSSEHPSSSTTDNIAGQRGIIAAQRRYAREEARGLTPLTIHQPGQSTSTQVIRPVTRQSPRLLELSQRRNRNPTQTSSSSSQQQQSKNGKGEWVQVLNPGYEKDPSKFQAGLKSSFKEKEKKALNKI